MSKNSNLLAAKAAKNDEFYTQLVDIENELQHYDGCFVGKTVYCNCDDPEWSNFWKYFSDNFDRLGLRKLISSHWVQGGQSYSLMMTAGGKVQRTDLEGDGDFRSEECIELLRQADVVVTNPPFSLFRDFVALVMEHNKGLLVIGNINAVTAKAVLPLFKDGRIRLGVSISSGDREFRVPEDYPLEAAGWRMDELGNRYIRVKGVRWFTNIGSRSYKPLKLKSLYDPARHLKYNNCDAINVDRVADITKDYFGEMGVPITFLDKHDTEQFEIVGNAGSYGVDGYSVAGEIFIGGRKIYKRIIIRRR